MHVSELSCVLLWVDVLGMGSALEPRQGWGRGGPGPCREGPPTAWGTAPETAALGPGPGRCHAQRSPRPTARVTAGLLSCADPLARLRPARCPLKQRVARLGTRPCGLEVVPGSWTERGGRERGLRTDRGLGGGTHAQCPGPVRVPPKEEPGPQGFDALSSRSVLTRAGPGRSAGSPVSVGGYPKRGRRAAVRL